MAKLTVIVPAPAAHGTVVENGAGEVIASRNLDRISSYLRIHWVE
jgi:phage replication-related protein YjqB (UPF0714/DUF867 family)